MRTFGERVTDLNMGSFYGPAPDSSPENVSDARTDTPPMPSRTGARPEQDDPVALRREATPGADPPLRSTRRTSALTNGLPA